MLESSARGDFHAIPGCWKGCQLLRSTCPRSSWMHRRGNTGHEIPYLIIEVNGLPLKVLKADGQPISAPTQTSRQIKVEPAW